jgi:hypothetical protein
MYRAKAEEPILLHDHPVGRQEDSAEALLQAQSASWRLFPAISARLACVPWM